MNLTSRLPLCSGSSSSSSLSIGLQAIALNGYVERHLEVLSAHIPLQMDQRPYPGPPLLFHFRMASLFMVLWATDLVMFVFTIEHTLTVGVGGMVLFASEVCDQFICC